MGGAAVVVGDHDAECVSMKQLLNASLKFAFVDGLVMIINVAIFNLLLLIAWFDQHVIWANVAGFVGG